ncbi:I78 family peptidase inhibitor [Ramlibacter lithotrophicus]|nr:I78 family peptidase inhibitor [Ramlibacter lithotrophicus]
MRHRLLLCISSAAIVGACASSPDTTAMGAAESTCRAAGAEALLGRRLDDMVLAEALRGSGGLRTRVIPPGGVVTMDHDPMRLNIELDDAGVIRRMRCG